MDELEIVNRQLVGVHGEQIVIMNPRLRMTKAEALVHAAFLVALAGDEYGSFQKILEQVQNT